MKHWSRLRGFTLLELLVAMSLLLLLAAGIAGLVGAFARASLGFPKAADQQQRLRAAADQISNWLAVAGQGLGGTGPDAGWLLVPPLYPQRRGVPAADPDTSAFSDRMTMIAGVDPPASASLLGTMSATTSPVGVDLSSCGPGLSVCGIGEGSPVLVSDARASGEWFTVTQTDPAAVHHARALSTSYSSSDGTMMAMVEVKTLVYDSSRRQLRILGVGSDQPFIDGVAAFRVRWFGDPQAPRGPIPPPGQSNCVVDSGGNPRLVTLTPTDGPWVELSPAALADGPWCGAAPWRFDADLFRVRLLRVLLRLDRPPLSGSDPSGGYDPFIELSIAPRNLLRLR